jgi:dienelactone hydrolase
MVRLLLAFVILYALNNVCLGQAISNPDTISVPSDGLTLKGLLWTPAGKGPFSTVIFCHGSYGGSDTIHDPIEQASLIGPVFASRGYLFLALFRRGVGLSKAQGINSTILMDSAFKERGQEGRNQVQLQQMETDQLQDMISGLQYLRNRKDVDTNRIGIVGHSFGGSLSLIVADHDQKLKAVVVFSPAGYSWNGSPQLRSRLIEAVRNINAPVMIVHALNDYSVNSGNAVDSVRKQVHKPHLLKIYPAFGSSANEAHNILFLGIQTWEADVFKFLDQYLR